jgi:protein NirF
MEFTARGDQMWLSVRDGGEVQVWDPYRLERLATLPAQSPSGIFFSSRAHKPGY